MLPAGNRLDDVYASLLARREAQGRLRQLTRSTGVDFSSNGYLSLQANADVRDALLARLRERPASRRGGGGSRLLDGNSAATEELERTLAAFHGAAAGLLFNSGFAANTGVFGCAPQAGDVVLYDELVHASVRDGLRLGRARAAAFAHNCVAGLDARLAEVLGDEGETGRAVGAGRARVFVAVESIYSMDGDVAPLRGLVDCLDRRLPLGNGLLFVDEAHALGLFGHRGRGLVSHLGLQHRVWASLYTFGKALGCAGAIVLCSPTTRSYLINYARSFIYTTAMDHDALAGIQTAYEYLMSGRAKPLAGHVRSLTQCAHRLLTSLCYRRRPPPQLFRVNPGEPQSPIIPLFTVQAHSLARHCQQRGFVLRAIMAPTVPTSRVRLCLHAGNSMQEVLSLCEAIEEWVCERLQWAKDTLSETPSKL